jgi:hypothetical protein
MLLSKISKLNTLGLEVLLEPYAWLILFALICFIGFYLCKNISLIKKASNYFLICMTFTLIIFFDFAIAEIYYYYSHGSFVTFETRKFDLPRDRSLINYDTKEDVVELKKNIFRHAKITKSDNAKYSLDPLNQKINLKSMDGKDAYIEFNVKNKTIHPNGFYQTIFSILVGNVPKDSTYISAFENQLKIKKKQSSLVHRSIQNIPQGVQRPLVGYYSPLQIGEFSYNSLIKKDDFYLIKRKLDLPFSKNWRYFQDGSFTVLQKRFHKDLRFVETIDIVFSENVTEDELRNVRCNFRISNRDTVKNDEVVPHYKLANGFNLIDETNQIIEIDGKKILRFNIGNLVRNAYEDKKVVYLEEMIIFFPEKLEKFFLKRPIKYINYNKLNQTRKLFSEQYLRINSDNLKKQNTLGFVKREFGFSKNNLWTYYQDQKFTIFNMTLHKDLHAIEAMDFALKRGGEVPNNFFCQVKVGFYKNGPSEIVNCDRLLKKTFVVNGQVLYRIQFHDLVRQYYSQGKKNVFLKELTLSLEGSADYYSKKKTLQGIRFYKFPSNLKKNTQSLFFVPNKKKENFSWCDVECSREGNHVLSVSFKNHVLKAGVLDNVYFTDSELSESFTFRLYTRGSDTIFRFPRLANVRIYPPQYNYKQNKLDLEAFQNSHNKWFADTINRKKDNSKIRIIFFGASETYGYGSKIINNSPLIFKGLINLWANGPEGKKFDVINMGMLGNTTFGWLYQYDLTDLSYRDPTWGRFSYLKYPSFFSEFTVKDLKPDIVILSVTPTDLLSETDWKRISFSGLAKDYSVNLVSKLLKVPFIHNNALGFYIFTALDQYSYSEDKNLNYVEFEERLNLLIKKLKKDGVRPILISIPVAYYELEKINARLMKKLSKMHNIPFYYLRQDNENLLRKEYWYDDNHPKASGYNDIALKLFNRIIKDSSLSDIIVSKFSKKVAVD